jgi:hypothetical protein
MSMKVILLAALILGCCLVSTVSAGCGGCGGSCGFGISMSKPDFSKLPYWGMSADDISKAIVDASSSADDSATTREWPPRLVLPTPNANKFGSLIEFNNKFGDSKSGSLSGSLVPVSETKQSLISLQNKNYYSG